MPFSVIMLERISFQACKTAHRSGLTHSFADGRLSEHFHDVAQRSIEFRLLREADRFCGDKARDVPR